MRPNRKQGTGKVHITKGVELIEFGPGEEPEGTLYFDDATMQFALVRNAKPRVVSPGQAARWIEKKTGEFYSQSIEVEWEPDSLVALLHGLQQFMGGEGQAEPTLKAARAVACLIEGLYGPVNESGIRAIASIIGANMKGGAQ